MEQIRLGLIGCGVMSRDSHSNGLKNIKNDCVVTAICDKRLYRAEQMYEALGGKEYGDILITEEGRCIIEANTSSGVNIIQLWGGQRHKELGDFYRYHGVIK